MPAHHYLLTCAENSAGDPPPSPGERRWLFLEGFSRARLGRGSPSPRRLKFLNRRRPTSDTPAGRPDTNPPEHPTNSWIRTFQPHECHQDGHPGSGGDDSDSDDRHTATRGGCAELVTGDKRTENLAPARRPAGRHVRTG